MKKFAYIQAARRILHICRQALREHDDEVLPREMIALAIILSAVAIALGLNADEKSSFTLWRVAADGFALNVLSNLALLGPSLVIANIFFARWRRRRQIRTAKPALDILYGVVDLTLRWSDDVWTVLHKVDLRFTPDPVSFQAPSHDGSMVCSVRSLEDQLELVDTRSRAFCTTLDLFAISGLPQPPLQPGTLPIFIYGLGFSMFRDSMLQLDAALGRSTDLRELADRIDDYERGTREQSGFGDLANSAGLVLDSLTWILQGLKENLPSHLGHLMEVDFAKAAAESELQKFD